MTEFRVEQSGWYRTRDGQEVECIAIWSRPCGNGFQATCLDKNEAYDVTAYGRYLINPEHEHGLDLVEYLGKHRSKQKKVVRMAPVLCKTDSEIYVSTKLFASEANAKKCVDFVRWLIDTHSVEVEVPDNG